MSSADGRLASLDHLLTWLRREGADAALITAPTSIAYLTGFSAEPLERVMALAVGPEEAVLIVPELESEPAQRAGRGIEVAAWRDGEDPYALIAQALGASPQRLAVEAEHLTLRAHAALAERVRASELVDASPFLGELRLRKSPEELRRLEEAASITDRVTGTALAQARAGMSEVEIGRLLDDAVLGAGASLSFPSLVQVGANAAEGHHRPGGQRLRRGDLLLLDFGAAVGGYCADTTRTFVAGEPSHEQRRIHELVLQAHDAAIACVRPGVTTGEVDEAARSVIRTGGHDEHFYHRVGHGLGLAEHEPPSVEPGSTVVLEPGMVFTIEPGIYIPGWGGVRIEDDVVVTEGGCRLLTQAARTLAPLPA